MNKNALLDAFKTAFGVPPFEQIKNEHYLPAYQEAIRQHKAEINAIVNNADAPTFANTIEALEYSGRLLDQVDNIFGNLMAANTNSKMQALAKDISPLLSAHIDDINLNKRLFERVKIVYTQTDKQVLNTEQRALLKETYKSFVRGGANLSKADSAGFREINKEVDVLSIQFGENLLAETNNFELWTDKPDDLAGLPQNIINVAKVSAKSRGHKDGWAFTLDQPSLMPFMTYSQKRALREQLFKGYISRGNNDNEHDNREIVLKIVNLRLERAKLLGYRCHADFILADNMAKNTRNVFNMMDAVMPKALNMAKKERDELQRLADNDGADIKIKPWDWRYYSERVRREKYDLDEEQLRPYFKLENVRDSLFDIARRLYGIKFERNRDTPTYHKEVEAYEVLDINGLVTGILYMDFFPRSSKRGGAWMTSFRKQYYENDKKVIPVISIVTNFTKPADDKPSLLTFEEVRILFHEFGHSLHGLLSDCRYRSLSGTGVPRDFVEMPSQIMENWASEPEVMKNYFKHYKTGDPIPDDLIKKIRNSARFNAGFAITEYTAAAYLDMYWHTITSPVTIGVNEFEASRMERLGLIPEIIVRYCSTCFSHIFAGGYSAGYYAYMWAEIIDADAFQAFQETSVFDKETARRFRETILSRGRTEDAIELYKKFRGREPEPEAYFKRKGLKGPL